MEYTLSRLATEGEFSEGLVQKNVWAFLILPPLDVFINRRVKYLWTTSIPKTSSSAA